MSQQKMIQEYTRYLERMYGFKITEIEGATQWCKSLAEKYRINHPY